MKKKRLIYLTGVFCLLLCACGQTQPGDTGREEDGVPVENGSRSGQADEVESGAEGAQQGGQADGAEGAQQGGQTAWRMCRTGRENKTGRHAFRI